MENIRQPLFQFFISQILTTLSFIGSIALFGAGVMTIGTWVIFGEDLFNMSFPLCFAVAGGGLALFVLYLSVLKPWADELEFKCDWAAHWNALPLEMRLDRTAQYGAFYRSRRSLV